MQRFGGRLIRYVLRNAFCEALWNWILMDVLLVQIFIKVSRLQTEHSSMAND